MALFQPDELAALLIVRAKAAHAITYGEVFQWFGLPFQRFQVGQLSAALALVDAGERAQGRPELAVLVVRQSDGLPGQGWWLALAKGQWSGPFEGPRAAAFVRQVQQRTFDYWARPS